MRRIAFRYVFVLLVLLLGCGEEPQNTASFRLIDVSTGWDGGSYLSPTINFTIENTGSVKISTIGLSFTFRTGGSDSRISGSDADRFYRNIPVGESRGLYTVMSSRGYTSSEWPVALQILQSNRSRPPTVEVRARVNGGAEFTYDTFDIYIP
ncbi:MAG: hypothetical protein KAR40_17600 [Candidatus Sabulitectum sp.]|nr:hypothetical protein [Candidatus Sabulitectum sp.]